MTKFLLPISVALLVAVTLLPLSRRAGWWIRDWDFPRLQIAILAFAVLIFELWSGDLSESRTQWMLAATLGCLAYQAWWILPYTRIYPSEVKTAATRSADRRIRILAANVLATNRNAEGLIAMIRQHQPDIFVTLESDHWWQQQLDTLAQDYPHAVKCPLENLYGMHVYSRLPLEDSSTQFLVERDVPSIHLTALLPCGKRVAIRFLHPAPPSPTENEESTERDAELLVVAKQVARLQQPVIVAGDLNDVAWSETTRLFRKISGLLDPRIGRGMFNTFHAGHWFMRWPLDHLFHSRHFTVAHLERLPAFGSDHFPMLVELMLEEERAAQQEGLHADSKDRAIAEEKIEAEALKKPGGP